MQRHIQGLRMVQLRHGRRIGRSRGEARAENSGERMGAAKQNGDLATENM
jgi:hypothetical protein